MSAAATNHASALVCVPSAIPTQERAAHFQLGRRLFTEIAEERINLASGIALRLPVHELEHVARFIANERKCCPFLHVQVDISPGGDTMWLRLTGPQGTRELIEAELGGNSEGSCRCNSPDARSWP
jgi:hypothetical protein